MHFAESLETRLLLAGEPKFVTPIAGVANQDWAIYSYFDTDPTSGAKDYRNGPYTFNGYQGTDFTLSTFAQMDAGVNVLAGAAGTVVYTHDGEFDRNLTLDPNRIGNEIVIDHGGGWKSVYQHLKKGSINVAVGAAVTAGQAIAKVGSSGNTDGAAVQFIVLHNGVPIDPFSAPATFWQNPAPYVGDTFGVMDSGVSNGPVLELIAERPNTSPVFSQGVGQKIFLWAYYAGVNLNDKFIYEIYQPDGFFYGNTPITVQGNYQVAFYFANFALNGVSGNPIQPGTWHAKIRYNGEYVVDKTFVVNATGTAETTVSLGADYIRNGRSTPIDFGSTYPGGINVTKTFTIFNRGVTTLNINQVQLPAGYKLQSAPATTVGVNDGTTFGVQLDTAVAGTKNGNIVVKTNDNDDANYTFAVTGIVYASAPKGTVKGSVYNDPNSDSVHNLGENAVGGVVVYIDANNNNTLDAAETKSTTDASGAYTFNNNVNAGTQIVRIVTPSGYRRTLPVPPANSKSISVTNGATNSGVDFCVTSNILASGVVFNDVNSNGTKDAGEAAIANVVIQIRSNNVTVATRTTDANGKWQVKGLSAGTGVAKATLPSGYTFTNPSNGQYSGSLTSGQQNQNLNFGLHKTSPVPFLLSEVEILEAADVHPEI